MDRGHSVPTAANTGSPASHGVPRHWANTSDKTPVRRPAAASPDGEEMMWIRQTPTGLCPHLLDRFVVAPAGTAGPE